MVFTIFLETSNIEEEWTVFHLLQASNCSIISCSRKHEVAFEAFKPHLGTVIVHTLDGLSIIRRNRDLLEKFISNYCIDFIKNEANLSFVMLVLHNVFLDRLQLMLRSDGEHPIFVELSLPWNLTHLPACMLHDVL